MVQLYKPKRSCSYRWKIFLNTFLALTLLLGTAAAQSLTVKGKITDGSTNEGLPGVNIGIKGTSSGTATDENGEFTLNAPADAILVISFIGYKTEEVAVNNQTFISVALQINAEILSEAVVVGYGSIEKKDATGALANVGTKDFNKGLIIGPEQLIVGKVAGLQVTPSGDPGGRADIRLRGVSLNGEYPLIVVDGVVLAEGGGGVTGVRNPLNFINPSDIATMNVLKDAQATAIYGARGANGVIMITTKSGVTGKPKISYDGLYSASIFTRRPDVFEASEFRQLISVKEPGFVDDLGSSNTNWLDEVSRVAQSTQHNVSVSGGSNKTTYYASLNYLGSQGVLNETSHQRVNLSLRLEQKLLNDNLKLTFNTKNGFTKDNLGPNVIGAASAYDPTRPVYDEANTATGGYYQWANTIATGNPVASQNQQSTIGNSYRNVSNLLVRYELPFLKGLSFNANFAYDLNDGTNKYTQDTLARGNVNGDIKSVYSEKRVNNLYEYYGNYHATFGKHTVDVTGGYAWQNFKTDFSQDSYSDQNPTNQDPVVNTPYVENRLISFFGRGTYDYAGKYLLTFSIRRDGSTRFGPDSRWGMFPAIGAGWRILEEGFAGGLATVFSELKIRGSYGITGNEQIGNYQYSTYYRTSLPGASYQFGNEYVGTLTPNGADNGLQWEENESINAGIDAGILGGKVTFSLDFYQRTVRELLYTISPPAGSIPDDQVLTNIGSVRNKGIEFVSTIVAYDRQNFDWTLGFNASYNHNEITQLDNLQGQALDDFPGYRSGGISGDVGQSIQIRKVGEPLDAFYVYQHKRNPDGSLVLDTNGDGVQTLLEMYEDLNNDGIINEDDLRPYKQPQPKVVLGLTSNMSYKNWDLAFTLRSNLGNWVYNNTASASGYYSRITESNVINNVHRSVLETDFKTKQLFSDYYVQDGSFLKLDNITLGYNFQNVAFTSKLRAYVAAQNPLVISGYKGVEAEQFYGIDNSPYPRSMTLTVGVNATFK